MKRLAFVSLLVMLTCFPAIASERSANHGIRLSPGETIISSFAAQSPAIVRIPPKAQQRNRRAQPPVEIDRVTRKHRNRAGWTGRPGKPAAVACFPAGTCARLNTN